MKIPEIIDEFGFERALSCHEELSPSDKHFDILDEIKTFEIDKVYFCEDDNNVYPAVFMKKVDSFSNEVLKKIARIHHKVWNYKKILFLYVYSNVEIRIYNCAEKPVVIGEHTDYKKEVARFFSETRFSLLVKQNN